MKVIINVPMYVECDIKSASNSDESAFNVDHTDFVELTNIVPATKVTLPISAISIIEN